MTKKTHGQDAQATGENPGRDAHATRKIEHLMVRDFKGIRLVEITPEGDLHEIRGDAGQGKTGILDAIRAAFTGADKDMVRQGADEAEIELRLSQETIHRIISGEDGKNQVMVTGADGAPIERVKDFLRAIYNPATLTPLEIVRLGGGESRGRTERLRQQRDLLLESLRVTLTEEDVIATVRGLGAEYVAALAEIHCDDIAFEQHPFAVCRAFEQACYEFRKDKNAAWEHSKHQLEDCPPPKKAASCSLEEAQAREEEAIEAYHAAKARAGNMAEQRRWAQALEIQVRNGNAELPKRGIVETRLEENKARKKAIGAEIESLRQRLNKLTIEQSEVQGAILNDSDQLGWITAHEARQADLEWIRAELADAGEEEDVEALETAMRSMQDEVQVCRQQERHDWAVLIMTAARERVEVFTRLVELFRDDLPKALLAQAELPCDGLSVDDEKIMIHDVPLHQLGTSEQIRVGVMLWAAMNPQCGFMPIDGAESLGREDLLALWEAAAERDLQLIMTFVDATARPGPSRTVMQAGEAVELGR